MVNCRKCGFSQPEDQYCANCGVNMLNFKPEAVPLHRKILSHTGVQILLAVIAIFGFIGLVKSGQRKALQNTLMTINSSHDAQVVEKKLDSGSTGGSTGGSTASALNVPPPAQQQDVGRSTSSSIPVPPPAVPHQQQGVNPAARTAAVSGETILTSHGASDLNATSGPSGEPVSLVIRVVALSIQKLNEIKDTANSQGPIHYGTFNDFATHFSSGFAVPPALSIATELPFVWSNNESFPIVQTGGPQAYGFSCEILTESVAQGVAKIKVVGLRRTLPSGIKIFLENNMSLNLSVPLKGGAFVTGIFDHTTLNDQERQTISQANSSLLNFLSHPDYLSREAEIALLITFQ